MKKTITEEELAILKDVSEREFLTLTEEEQKSIKIIVNRIEKEEQEEREKEEVLFGKNLEPVDKCSAF